MKFQVLPSKKKYNYYEFLFQGKNDFTLKDLLSLMEVVSQSDNNKCYFETSENQTFIRHKFSNARARIFLQKTVITGLQKLVIIDSGSFDNGVYIASIGSEIIHKYVDSIWRAR